MILDISDLSRIEELGWEEAEFMNLFDFIDLPSFLYSPLLEHTHALRIRYPWCNIHHSLLNQSLIPFHFSTSLPAT